MRFTFVLPALACAGVLSSRALAQDSVSLHQGLPGDALDSRDVTQQLSDYVVDQTALTSTWGKVFAIAPIAKATRQQLAAPTFFTKQIGAQALSRKLASNVPFLRSQYVAWNGTGFGANPDPAHNTAGTNVNTSAATGFQFAFGMNNSTSLGGSTTTFLADVNGGIVNFTGARPSRLHVARVIAAENSPSDTCVLSSFGMGAVDEDGNLVFRADGNGQNNTNCPAFTSFPSGTSAPANNQFRVRLAARTAALNVLSNSYPTSADPAATDWLLVNSTVTHNCPNLVPNSVAGRPILITSNFGTTTPFVAGQYVFESAVNTLTTSAPAAHLTAATVDHRGNLGYSIANFPSLFAGSTMGTAAIIAKPTALSDNLAIFGVDGTGSYVNPILRALPAVVTDPDQAWTNTLAAGTQGFDHYHGSIAFQGGSGPVALGKDQAGNLLVAAPVYYGGVSNSTPNNYLAVAKIDPLGGGTTWSVAAWTLNDPVNYGKNVYMNGTTVIGHLKPFGSAPLTGPTMSAPMFDSVGNVWFTGALELNATPGTVQMGLMRAVLQPATFSYKIELVFKVGDVFAGQNSGTNYKIDFLPISTSTGVISAAAPWSSNITEGAFRNQSAAGLATSDAATLGGLVIQASIVYDVNNDGLFVKSTGTGGTPGSPDEDYTVLLYVAASTDCNANNIPDDAEIASGTQQDSNGNGVPDSCEGITGLPFCFGDGTGVLCPCQLAAPPGGTGPIAPGATGNGCPNSVNPLGANLAGTGTASLSNDTVVLLGTGMPNSSALYFQGTTQQAGGNGAAFGDGKRCASGSIIRLKTVTNVAGASQYPQPGDPSVSVKGLVTGIGTRTYQCWYRNAALFCVAGATFNLSNGLQISWGI